MMVRALRSRTVGGMAPSMLSRTAAHRRGRGSTMLEFALMLPFFLLFVLFSLNIGVLVTTQMSVQYATYVGARTGAQVGGANVGGAQTSVRAINQLLDDMPLTQSRDATITVVSGGTCQNNATHRNVTIRTRYNARFITPGLGALLRLSGGADTNTTTWAINTTALARCEVVR